MTTPPNQDRQPRDTVVTICTTVLALALIALYGWQSSAGVDTSETLLLLVAVLAGIPGVAVMRQMPTLRRQVDTVQVQTNGTQGRLLDIIEHRLPLAPADPVPGRPDAHGDARTGESTPPAGPLRP